MTSFTLGSRTYSQNQLLALMVLPAEGDASLILTDQLIAAKLNVALNGDSGSIQQTIAQADLVLSLFSGRLPYGISPSTPIGSAMVALAAALDGYNNSNDRCEIASVTPVATVTRTITPPAGTATVTKTPTATTTGTAPTSTPSASATATSTPFNVCPLTQGYWKNHPSAWPVTSLQLGTRTYSQSQLLDILQMQAQGDASLMLAHQLIAAKLNVASGVQTLIAPLIVQADALLAGFSGPLPYAVAPSSSMGQEMVSVAAGLDRYNNSCDSANQHRVLSCPDVPAPALIPGSSGGRDDVVSISDVVAIVYYIGVHAANPDLPNASGARYGGDIDGDGIPDGAEYDGSEWGSGDGLVSMADAIYLLSRIGDSCVSPEGSP